LGKNEKEGGHKTDGRGDPRFKRMSKNPLPEKGLRWLNIKAKLKRVKRISHA